MAARAVGCMRAGVAEAAGGAGQVKAQAVLELRRRELVEGLVTVHSEYCNSISFISSSFYAQSHGYPDVYHMIIPELGRIDRSHAAARPLP